MSQLPFDLAEATSILERTPATLRAWLPGLPERWLHVDEGPGTWSAYQILGHLIFGEETDWIPRARIVLEAGERRTFDPFDREAMLKRPARPLLELLDRFEQLRRENLATLAGWKLTSDDLTRTGRHPAIGVVTLAQLLATWVVHDTSHIAQIARVLTLAHRDAVGPWKNHFRLLHD